MPRRNENKNKDEHNPEIPENKDWHLAVHAARVQGQSLWFVRASTGDTLDVCLSEGLARKWIDRTRAPKHLFKVYEQTPLGVLKECRGH